MLFETPRSRLVILTDKHAELLHDYYTRNQDHLVPWEPIRSDGYHSISSWQQRGREFYKEYEDGVSVRILALQPDGIKIIGVCFFTNIVRGVFSACNVGYSISHERCGHGLMTEIVSASVDYVFEQLDLHRIMANYVPENDRSARVLEKIGFEKEGYAKSYLQIAGKWRDHILTSKINPNHTGE